MALKNFKVVFWSLFLLILFSGLMREFTCRCWSNDSFPVEAFDTEVRERHAGLDGNAPVSTVPGQSQVRHAVANWKKKRIDIVKIFEHERKNKV